MNTRYHFNNLNKIRFLDHSNKKKLFTIPNEALTSFAVDDTIATTVGNKTSLPTVRIWVHAPTLVMGIPDSRLPYIKKGIQYIKQQNMNIIIRNSGGLAVFLDHGVLNMSIIVPNDKQLNIHDGYKLMYYFIQNLFREYTNDIQAYEIVGSYCPGDYDLSINGIKFAGISQRRIRNGIAIQIYIDVNGNSHERAAIVKEFYQLGKQNAETKHQYPDIHPLTMGTISDLLDNPFTVPEVIHKIKERFMTNNQIVSESFIPEEEELFFNRLSQMKKRNEKLHLA